MPNNIHHLTFGFDYNQPVDYKVNDSDGNIIYKSALPYNTTHLIFDWSFNVPIHKLPPNIQYIKIYKRYLHMDQLLNILPSCVKLVISKY